MKLDIQSPEELEVAARAIEDHRKQQRGVGRFSGRVMRLCEEGVREFAFARTWHGWTNRDEPWSLLDELLAFDSSRSRVRDYSQDEVVAVATIIQWLGTKNGMDFLETALDRAGFHLVFHGRSTTERAA